MDKNLDYLIVILAAVFAIYNDYVVEDDLRAYVMYLILFIHLTAMEIKDVIHNKV